MRQRGQAGGLQGFVLLGVVGTAEYGAKPLFRTIKDAAVDEREVQVRSGLKRMRNVAHCGGSAPSLRSLASTEHQLPLGS